eukprot:NODE_8856_length_536_cov_33.655257_g8833_i0.p2 GENE.NODE_8856_length_536_cov_33.655257_g8833_i0~~NODE_8856_length_536_cov_33.655257_g8833_i0.p2  ORF type:complete len:132 (+),score=19.62 NODE_8856_length_536_cov_33.655257_g8833_i0:56-451(+)
MKGNQPVPNAHFHKHWNPTGSQKGHVKVFLRQAAQKKIRRQKREAKAKAMFPAPLNKARPVVQCCTQRYNMKPRFGRGYCLAELRACGLTPATARQVGISVDRRRQIHSEETLARNTERLKNYLARVTVVA